MAKTWIQKATANNKGAFTRQAKAAGMTVSEFAEKTLAAGSHASATTKRRARLAQTLRTIAHGQR